MDNKDIKDKAVFVVGLLAAFLAFTPFKEELSSIIIRVANQGISLFQLMLFFICALTFSVYLYALDYLRYSFGKYQNFFLFRIIVPLANFFYSVAILFPFFVLVMWFFSIPQIYSITNKYKNDFAFFDVVVGLPLVVFSFINAIFLTKRSKKEEVKRIQRSKSNFLEKALQLFNNKFYAETILEAFKVLELTLREELLKKRGLTTQYTSMGQILELALKYKVIDKKIIPAVKDLQRLRNQAAHFSINFDRQHAESALSIVKEVLEYRKEA